MRRQASTRASVPCRLTGHAETQSASACPETSACEWICQVGRVGRSGQDRRASEQVPPGRGWTRAPPRPAGPSGPLAACRRRGMADTRRSERVQHDGFGTLSKASTHAAVESRPAPVTTIRIDGPSSRGLILEQIMTALSKAF